MFTPDIVNSFVCGCIKIAFSLKLRELFIDFYISRKSQLCVIRLNCSAKMSSLWGWQWKEEKQNKSNFQRTVPIICGCLMVSDQDCVLDSSAVITVAANIFSFYLFIVTECVQSCMWEVNSKIPKNLLLIISWFIISVILFWTCEEQKLVKIETLNIYFAIITWIQH